MKYANDLMSSKDTQYSKIGDFATRSSRNKFSEEHENMIRDNSPYPISYDVTQVQTTNFSEFTYTELLSGFWIATQSLDINCRLLQDASEVNTRSNINLESIVADKYNLSSDISKYKNAKKICFLPGHNMLDVASVEIIARLVHEEDDVLVKPHPITNDESLNMLAQRFGWNKIIDRNVSGDSLIKNCDVVYTTTASEMAISGTILGKKVVNVSNFFNEGSGAYHPLTRILFQAHKNYGVEEAQRLLKNIFACEWSGVVSKESDIIEERIKSYYSKALEYRDKYKSLASPKGNPPKKG
jgi:hypothetical protein